MQKHNVTLIVSNLARPGGILGVIISPDILCLSTAFFLVQLPDKHRLNFKLELAESKQQQKHTTVFKSCNVVHIHGLTAG